MTDKIVLTTEEGKKVVIDTNTDEELYSAPVNPPKTGTRFTRGIDLYLNISSDGTKFFYTHSWSMWEGETDRYNLISEHDARSFLIEKINKGKYVRPSFGDIERYKEIWSDFPKEVH